MKAVGYHGTNSKYRDSIEKMDWIQEKAHTAVTIGWVRAFIFLTIIGKRNGGPLLYY